MLLLLVLISGATFAGAALDAGQTAQICANAAKASKTNGPACLYNTGSTKTVIAGCQASKKYPDSCSETNFYGHEVGHLYDAFANPDPANDTRCNKVSAITRLTIKCPAGKIPAAYFTASGCKKPKLDDFGNKYFGCTPVAAFNKPPTKKPTKRPTKKRHTIRHM